MFDTEIHASRQTPTVDVEVKISVRLPSCETVEKDLKIREVSQAGW